MKVDPFTRTPGVDGAAFIDMHYADEIIQSFQSNESSKYVYQVLGSLYFKRPKPVFLQEFLPEFDKILSRDSYELVWESLT